MVNKTPRKFRAEVSLDNGDTWKKLRASGYAIDPNPKDGIAKTIDGYVIVIDNGDSMIDVILTEKDLKMIVKDIKNSER